MDRYQIQLRVPVPVEEVAVKAPTKDSPLSVGMFLKMDLYGHLVDCVLMKIGIDMESFICAFNTEEEEDLISITVEVIDPDMKIPPFNCRGLVGKPVWFDVHKSFDNVEQHCIMVRDMYGWIEAPPSLKRMITIKGILTR